MCRHDLSLNEPRRSCVSSVQPVKSPPRLLARATQSISNACAIPGCHPGSPAVSASHVRTSLLRNRRAAALRLNDVAHGASPTCVGFQGGEIPKSLLYYRRTIFTLPITPPEAGNGSLLLHIAPCDGRIYTLELYRDPGFLQVPLGSGFPASSRCDFAHHASRRVWPRHPVSRDAEGGFPLSSMSRVGAHFLALPVSVSPNLKD